MDKEKQIEEMAKTLCSDYGECKYCICKKVESETNVCTVESDCEELYNAGYRKASEVAEEIFAEIWENEHKGDFVILTARRFAELKKKYRGKKNDILFDMFSNRLVSFDFRYCAL